MHIKDASRYSAAGFLAAFQDEVAFRLVLAETLILLPIAFIIGPTFTTTIILIIPLFISIIVELLNSAIENTLDRISLEIHPLTKKAKDMGSAAQCTAQILLILVWVSFFILSPTNQ